MPAKQYRNSIRKRRYWDYVPLFTSDHMHVHELSQYLGESPDISGYCDVIDKQSEA